MAAPEFLVNAAQGWARVYADTRALSIGVTFLHLAGLLLGGGAAVAADRQTLKAARGPEPVRAIQLAYLDTTHAVAIAGLAVLTVSGLAMLLADLETFWQSRTFWIKMCLALALLANGILIRHAERLARTAPAAGWTQLRVTAIISLILWFAVVLAGVVLASS